MQDDSPLATEKQIALMRSLGLVVSSGCTVGQAAEAIGGVRIIHCFAAQIAEQEWRQSLEDRDLRPLVTAVLAKPGMAAQIQDIMDASAQAAWTARTDQDANGSSARRLATRKELTPDLREDGNYLFVKMKLERLFPDLPQELPVAMPAPQMRVFLAREDALPERVMAWVNEFLGR